MRSLYWSMGLGCASSISPMTSTSRAAHFDFDRWCDWYDFDFNGDNEGKYFFRACPFKGDHHTAEGGHPMREEIEQVIKEDEERRKRIAAGEDPDHDLALVCVRASEVKMEKLGSGRNEFHLARSHAFAVCRIAARRSLRSIWSPASPANGGEREVPGPS